MAKLEKPVQTVQCVKIRDWETTTTQGKPIVKKIGIFVLDGQEFEVFETQYFIPEEGAVYAPHLFVDQSAKISPRTGNAYISKKVGVQWEKVS
jgi:hypothetical protein